MSVSDSCKTGINAIHNDGPRPMPPKVVVLHDTEGGTAESIAHYFTEPSSGGSAQLVVDDNECYRCMPDTDQPWGAPGANKTGVHIEFCGWAKWKTMDWHHHDAMLHRGAYKVAAWCREYKIPVRHLTVSELKSGEKGIVTHADVTAAYHLSTHTDPGIGFPMAYFLDAVDGYLHPAPPPKPEPEAHYVTVNETGVVQGPWYVADVHAQIDRFQARHADDPDTAPDVSINVRRIAQGAPHA